MHIRFALHSDLSMTTACPSGLEIAPVGHAFRQGASSQWLHSTGTKWRRACGYLPSSTYFTVSRKTPSGTSYSALHATEHAWQPMHVRRSMSIPRRMASEPFPEPEFLEHHLSHVPPPACWIQLDLRGGLREEVATPHSGFAISNLDEAFAGSV